MSQISEMTTMPPIKYLGIHFMSQGFESKSTSAKKSSLPQLPLREVAEIQDIQRPFSRTFCRY